MEEKFKGKKILITGINGFIGANLAKKLHDLGAVVEGTTRERGNARYLKAAKETGSYNLHKLNIRNFSKVIELIKNNSFDYVFHLASQSDTWKSIIEPYDTIQTNVVGTLNLLEAIRNNSKQTKIILSGTVRAFYDSENAMNKNGTVLHPYDASKMSMEAIASSYFRAYDINGVIAKNTNIYGGNDLNFSRIIPLIMKQTIEDKKIQLKGTGLVKRDFMFIEDAVDGFLKLASNLDEEKVRGKTFTFATEKLTTIRELCEEVSKIVDFPLPIEFDDSIAFADRDQSSLSTKLSGEILGWNPQTSLSEGLTKTLEWYQQYFNGGI
jgi:CDP-glucose 4,6-dehydratase